MRVWSVSVRTGASDGVHALVDRLTDFVRHVPPPRVSTHWSTWRWICREGVRGLGWIFVVMFVDFYPVPPTAMTILNMDGSCMDVCCSIHDL